MTAAHTTTHRSRAAIGGWKELANRENSGLQVSLQWSKPENLLKVIVIDARLDDEFEFDVAGTEALAAFYHPFAFAATRGLSFGDRLGESSRSEQVAA